MEMFFLPIWSMTFAGFWGCVPNQLTQHRSSYCLSKWRNGEKQNVADWDGFVKAKTKTTRAPDTEGHPINPASTQALKVVKVAEHSFSARFC